MYQIRYCFGFNGKEKVDEVYGDANAYDFGARLYDPRIGRWLAVDPAFNKYPSLSPYGYTNNNPIWFYEVDGAIFDYSNLSDEESKNLKANLKVLNSNKLFRVYFRRLEKSDIVYTIKPGAGAGGSGSYSSTTNTIHAVEDISVLSQELFHAYQNDLGVYTDKDASVRETEGDLLSSSVANSVGKTSFGGGWDDQGIVFNPEYTDNDLIFTEGVLSESFDNDFNNAVNARIDYYKNGVSKAPASYIQDNSGTQALAIKKAVREVGADSDNLEGPRLKNGDYYEK
jgi:RHS repeat-associated protein